MSQLEKALHMKSFENDFQKLHLNIHYTSQHFENLISKSFKEYGLSIPQYNVLRILRGQKGNAITAIDIQKRMIHKTSNISRILDKLEEKEYAHRVDCEENRRKRFVYIQPKGLAILDEVEPIVQSVYKSIEESLKTSHISAEDFNNLLDTFRASSKNE